MDIESIVGRMNEEETKEAFIETLNCLSESMLQEAI